MASDKPFSASCVENRAPILEVLQPRLRDRRLLLEIGSGTGQHAVYFAAALPELVWQTSDLHQNHAAIRAWIDDAQLPNTRPPLALDVLADSWPVGPFDAAFSANTAHIMSEQAVEAMFRGIGRVLRPGAPFLLYGPFNFDGRYTSESNARFDEWLRDRDPTMGIRDLVWLSGLAADSGLALDEDIEMPVNNRTLVWRRAA